jgi:diguanylate cyclase (GGDEF)-like protein
MKVERNNAPMVGPSTARRGQPADRAASGGGTLHAVSDTTELLGIPESEITPKVRAAIMSLMAEVAKLREEVMRGRGRIDHLEKLADQDSLLPVYNRRAFVRELTRVISITERYGTPSSVIYFDVDGMKQINDRFGHGAGDVALLKVAERLRVSVRESDVIGRLGGDEFGVILYSADAATAQSKASSLAEAVSHEPVAFGASSIKLGVTFGIYTFSGKEDPGQVLAAADEAMYARKKKCAPAPV